MLKFLLRFLDFFVPASMREDPDLHLKGRLMVQSFLLVMPLMIGYSIQYSIVGHYWGAGYAMYGFVTASGALLDFRRRGKLSFSGNFFAFTSFFIVTAFTLTTRGFGTLISPWIIMVPISGFLLVGIRSGIFWSIASVMLVVVLFIVERFQIPLPNYVADDALIYINATSLLGLIGYIVIILLNNDLGKARLLQALRKAKNDVDRKNTEITAINQGLETTIAQRTHGLKTANEELDTFLYESSHALRRPLVRIVGLLSIVEQENSPEEKQQFMNLISYTALNMDKMLHDLLLVSEVYQRELQISRVELKQEFEALIAQTGFEHGNVKLEVPEGMSVETDGELLRIILKKLLDNAQTYRRSGIPHEVHVRAQNAGAKTRICISDNGIGIEASVLPQLFRMFARGTEQSRGSGLGLFIVAKATARLGGKVWIESEKGTGTQVYLELG